MKIKSLHNIKIRTKLIVLGTVSIAGLVLVGGMSVITAREINQASRDITQEWMPSVIIAEELNTATSDYRIKEYYHVITKDPEVKKRLEGEMDDLRNSIDKDFRSYEPLVTNETDRRMMIEARELWGRYLTYSDSLLALSRDGANSERVLNLIVGESRQLFDGASSLFLEVVKFNKDGALQASADSEKLYFSLSRYKVAVVVVLGVVIAVMIIYLIRSVEKPVEDIVDGVRRVSNGDLNVSLDYVSEDEIGILTESVNSLISRLRDIIKDEQYLFDEIGCRNFKVKSSCEQAYRGDFAPILYSIESLQSRLEEIKAHQDRVRGKRKNKAELREMKNGPRRDRSAVNVKKEIKVRDLKQEEREQTEEGEADDRDKVDAADKES